MIKSELLRPLSLQYFNYSGLTQGAMNCATTNQVPFEKGVSFKVPSVCSDAIYRINA